MSNKAHISELLAAAAGLGEQSSEYRPEGKSERYPKEQMIALISRDKEEVLITLEGSLVSRLVIVFVLAAIFVFAAVTEPMLFRGQLKEILFIFSVYIILDLGLYSFKKSYYRYLYEVKLPKAYADDEG